MRKLWPGCKFACALKVKVLQAAISSRSKFKQNINISSLAWKEQSLLVYKAARVSVFFIPFIYIGVSVVNAIVDALCARAWILLLAYPAACKSKRNASKHFFKHSLSLSCFSCHREETCMSRRRTYISHIILTQTFRPQQYRLPTYSFPFRLAAALSRNVDALLQRHLPTNLCELRSGVILYIAR